MRLVEAQGMRRCDVEKNGRLAKEDSIRGFQQEGKLSGSELVKGEVQSERRLSSRS
jgi:hypothetical protein